jgi:hypothetical protein
LSPENDFNNEFLSLTPAQRAEVMGFIRSLKGRPQGTPGHELLKFKGLFPAEDLAEIEAAIEQGCEWIDHDAW